MSKGQQIALITTERELSYEALLSLSDEISDLVVSRSVVLFMGTNSVESIAGYIGFLRKRAVPLMVTEKLPLAAINELIDAYTPEYLWLPKDIMLVDEVVSKGLYASLALFDEYVLLASLEECERCEPFADLALLLTTSGSTGSPRYVRLSYHNLESNATSIAEYMGIKPNDRAITTLPFSYSYGVSIINSHLVSGASLVLTGQSLLSREFWDLIQDKGVTNFGGVPYTYTMLRRLRFERKSIPSLRFITQAGGRLDLEIQKEFATIAKNRGFDFYVMYGQTEATARMSYLDPKKALTKLGSVGMAIPRGSFELNDDDGCVVTASFADGELVYRGPNVSLGYASSRSDLALGDDRNGILFTGDIARRDEEGYYSIVGRKKRFLKIFGNRVNLDELEAIMAQQGLVVACGGVDDAVRVFTESDPKLVSEAINASTGLYKGAFIVVPIDEIPRNEAGKILYSSLE